MSKTDARIQDILALVSHVRSHPGRTLEELAQAMDLPTPKVLELIKQATLCGRQPFGPGDLIEIHIDDEGRVHLELDQSLAEPLQLTIQEALALTVALHGFLQTSDGPYAKTARSALEKLKSRLSEDVDHQVAEVEHRIAVSTAEQGLEARLVRLKEGLEQKHSVDITYYTNSRDAMTERRLHTYLLIQHLGDWYAVGHDDRSGEIRRFKVERMKSVGLTPQSYEIPESFSPDAYKTEKFFAGEPQHGKVRFVSPKARFIKEEWAAEDLEDDGDAVIADFLYTHIDGAAAAILGHGAAAETLQPAELRDAVARRAKQTLKLYD